MENVIDKLYNILIEAGINKKNIEKEEDLILFIHKKIKYSVQIDGENDFGYGPTEFENQALTSDYLHDRYSEYGELVDFEDFVFGVVNNNIYGDLYRITEKLLKLEDEVKYLDIDFEGIVNHMFPN